MRTKIYQFILYFSNHVERWKYSTLIYSLILLLIIIISALNTATTINFYPINGTFQNFNPVHRLMDGQLPFVDFYDYLGLGHLYTGAAVTCALGGEFNDSLIAFNFLSLLSFVLITYLIGIAISNNRFISIIVTILVTIFSILLFKDIVFAGNSARMLRGMIVALVCIFWIINNWLINKLSFANKYQNYFQIFYWSLISALCLFWSNDYGISSWFCIILLIFITTYIKTYSLKSALLVSLQSLIISLFIIFGIAYYLTNGEPLLWFNLIFGNGAFQAWYYNGNKSYFIWDFDYSFGVLIQCCICIIYFIKLCANSYNQARYMIPFFVNLTSLCALNEYRLFSGGYTHEVAYSILFATIIFEIVNFLHNCNKFQYTKKIWPFIITLTSLLSISSLLILSINYYKHITLAESGTYFKNLGGYMTKLDNDIINASIFLKNSKVFATYASAQEIISNSFQPSGTDYIIHVLGNTARQNYLSSFKNQNFDYTSTIKETFTDWEHWVKRANWFFYRELYNNWHPVYSNSYQTYWVRNDNNNFAYYIGDFAPTIVKINEQNLKIIINLDKNISGTADVYIDYKIDNKANLKSKIISPFLIRKLAEVKNTGFNFSSINEYDKNYLQSSSKEFIPINVVNGYGEVTISSQPQAYTKLIINNITCNKIFRVDFDYLEIVNINTIGNNTFLIAENNRKNKYILNGIKKIKIANNIYNVKNVKQNSDKYFITISGFDINLTPLKNIKTYNNYAYIIREATYDD